MSQREKAIAAVRGLVAASMPPSGRMVWTTDELVQLIVTVIVKTIEGVKELELEPASRVPSESPDMGEPDRSLRIETPSEAIDALNEFAALVCIGKRPHELYFVLLDFLTGLPRLDVSARPASASSEETPK